VTRNKPFYFRVRNAIQEAGIQENMAWKGQEIIKAGPCSLTVLNPPPILGVNGGRQATFHSGSALNNQSVITQLDCGQHSFLFTADAERKALQRLNQEPGAHTARVVKVPHHGAKSSLYRPWINQLKAEAAIISVGKRNRFGHPVSAVLHAYDQKGIPMYRTDKDGAVWITAKLSSSDLVIQTAKDLVLHPVRLDASVLEQEAHNWTRLCSQWLGVI
jgi:competence protein ComEC